MRPRRTVVTTVLALLALGAGAGVANASSTADATQTTDANLTTFVAPGDTLEALRAGTGTEVLTRRQRVTLSDTLVVRVSTPGLGSAVADQPGNTTTERFRALLSGSDASLTAVEITSGGDPPRAIDLTAEQLVVSRAGPDSFDLIYDTGELRATDDRNGNGLADDGSGTAIVPVRVFEFEFAHDGTAASSSLGIFPPTITFSTPPADGVVLYPLPGQRLVGQTPLAPGTTLSISIDGVGHPFEIQRTTTVTGNQQSFANLSLDLIGAPAGIPLAVRATVDGQLLPETRGQLAELTASFTAATTDAPRTRLRLRNVSLSSAGFLVVRNGPDGSLVANRYVEAGEYDSLTVQYRRAVTADSVVVTAYVDVDGNRFFEASGPDRPFRRDGDPVSSVVDLDTSTPTTDTPTTAPPTTSLATDTPTATPSSPTTTGTPAQRNRITDASGDGFGLGVALAALAVVLVALARCGQSGT
ncbi:DUF7282 domain-containing protein [Halorientalis pallida]|uniref:DUF7282 domain-containing protein n=1 Tax=Halorientalis pallida TaxID=2479928 RepID=A0A498L2R0_9EURY|nr:hypothetical protein [Halorientalis pallida]RXK50044.1 hypothetical protein EAF64_05620 [Halorientalis pallida]